MIALLVWSRAAICLSDQSAAVFNLPQVPFPAINEYADEWELHLLLISILASAAGWHNLVGEGNCYFAP
jgi:hypothetical protein